MPPIQASMKNPINKEKNDLPPFTVNDCLTCVSPPSDVRAVTVNSLFPVDSDLVRIYLQLPFASAVVVWPKESGSNRMSMSANGSEVPVRVNF